MMKKNIPILKLKQILQTQTKLTQQKNVVQMCWHRYRYIYFQGFYDRFHAQFLQSSHSFSPRHSSSSRRFIYFMKIAGNIFNFNYISQFLFVLPNRRDIIVCLKVGFSFYTKYSAKKIIC
jgi:hypothetical protein